MRQIGFLTLLVTAGLLITLAFPAAAAGPKAAVAAAVPAPAAAAATPAPPQGRHPQIADALEAMRNARRHLADAAHDFHGHRVKSIEHLDLAIHEAEICMQEP